MKLSPEADYCVVDVETANSSRHSICQIGIARFRCGQMLDGWQSLVDPEEHFSAFNVQLHGIGPETVAGAPNWSAIFPKVARLLDGAAVASHTSFDRSAMEQASQRWGVRAIAYGKWLDTCGLARSAFPELPNHKLPTLARIFGIHYKAHDALEDARVAGEVLSLALERRQVKLEDLIAIPQLHIGSFSRVPTSA